MLGTGKRSDQDVIFSAYQANRLPDYPCRDFLIHSFVHQHPLCKYKCSQATAGYLAKNAKCPHLFQGAASSSLHSRNVLDVFEIKAGNRKAARTDLRF